MADELPDHAGYAADDDQDVAGDDEDQFDCPRFWTPDGWHCPAQGSEDCDWACPYREKTDG